MTPITKLTSVNRRGERNGLRRQQELHHEDEKPYSGQEGFGNDLFRSEPVQCLAAIEHGLEHADREA